MRRRIKPTAKLLLMFCIWLVTVVVRFHFRVEPGQALWYGWVSAQAFCAGSFGYMVALMKWNNHDKTK